MQIVIPMSGLGSRFIRKGYKKPKPLIAVYGKPIIEWVISMFPGESNILFLCREEHIETTDMEETLLRICPSGKIVAIKGHKLGPVYAVSQAFDQISDIEPVIVSYCDYFMDWDYEKFIIETESNECDGAIPCYTGFHPNLIPQKNVYASCLVNDTNNLLEIREKHSWTKDKTKALHSPGVYFFKNGALLKKYFKQQLESGQALNGEHYVSLVYNFLVKDGLKVWVPANVNEFCQWGTPEDLDEFLYWTQHILKWKEGNI